MFNNRGIIGYSIDHNKSATSVYQAFLNCIYPLTEIKINHTYSEISLKTRLSQLSNK